MASSTRSTARAKSSTTSSRAQPATSTSSRTTSTSSTTDAAPHTVVIALGSNLGDRAHHLRRALHELHGVLRIVRVSSPHDTAPVDAPPGSPRFLNMVVSGYTTLAPHELMHELLAIERRLGRTRGRTRNAPRVIDLDLVLFSGVRVRDRMLTLPHPRAASRAFVTEPLREIAAWLLRAL